MEEALAQPRFHHQWQPDELKIERKAGESVIQELQRRGHRVAPLDSLGATQAVAREGTGFSGAHDPRVSGQALGW